LIIAGARPSDGSSSKKKRGFAVSPRALASNRHGLQLPLCELLAASRAHDDGGPVRVIKMRTRSGTRDAHNQAAGLRSGSASCPSSTSARYLPFFNFGKVSVGALQLFAPLPAVLVVGALRQFGALFGLSSQEFH